MKTFTIDDIRNFDPKPCYDPNRYLPEDWNGTALDILRVEDCPPKDRLWVVCHEGWIDDRTLRLFAVWCAREALALIDNPDPRSVAETAYPSASTPCWHHGKGHSGSSPIKILTRMLSRVPSRSQ